MIGSDAGEVVVWEGDVEESDEPEPGLSIEPNRKKKKQRKSASSLSASIPPSMTSPGPSSLISISPIARSSSLIPDLHIQ